ncbi:MAG TPA: response regulator transcription factor [Anaerolineaceae bacterium]|nr:response regulator transcription factor [Anaerolineaceae bacterium]
MSPKIRILLIEGKRADHLSFNTGLTRKGFLVESVPSGSAAMVRLAQELPEVVVVDAASMRTSGRRICQSIRQFAQQQPVVLVVEQVSESEEKPEADVVLVQPFTLQKLVNRIRPLLPAEHSRLIQAGGLQLHPEQRWVRVQGRQVALTPRLVSLLKILMERPGEVIGREELFRQVWETEYTGDTRTLDVHISWLRQAVEENPRKPRYIKTVRGMGYRLDNSH